MMKQLILILSLLICVISLCAQEIITKPVEFLPAFEVEDSSEVFDGGMHTTIKGQEQWLLLDGYDIQGLNNADSLYGSSELYIQNLGGDLYLGNNEKGVIMYGLVRLDTLSFGSGGGVQTRASSEIAFGNITKGLLPLPSISSGTDNFSISWNSIDLRYEIEFDDYDYSLNGYTTVVTPRGSNIHRWRANGDKTSNKLFVYLYDNLGASIRGSFQFVTYYFQEGEDEEVLVTKSMDDNHGQKRSKRR